MKDNTSDLIPSSAEEVPEVTAIKKQGGVWRINRREGIKAVAAGAAALGGGGLTSCNLPKPSHPPTSLTDGASFKAKDFKDPKRLADKLKAHNGPATKRVWSFVSATSQAGLQSPNVTPAEIASILVTEFNRIITLGTFYLEGGFGSMNFPEDTRKLLIALPSPFRTIWMNRHVLHDLFPEDISPAPPHGPAPSSYSTPTVQHTTTTPHPVRPYVAPVPRTTTTYHTYSYHYWRPN